MNKVINKMNEICANESPLFKFTERKEFPFLIIFIVPAFVFFPPQLILTFKSSQWDYICSNPIQLSWLIITSITVFILAFIETFGERIKDFKYYYCTTMFLYEFIGFLSIVAYIDVLMNVWSFGECVKAILHMKFDAGMIILCVLMNWITYCSYWRRISNSHIEKCKSTAAEENEEEEIEEQEETNDYFMMYIRRIDSVSVLQSFAFLLTIATVVWCIYLSFIQCPDEIRLIGCILSNGLCLLELMLMSIFLGNIAFSSGLYNYTSYKICMFVLSFVLVYLRNDYSYPNELNQAQLIFSWMCCILAGRSQFINCQLLPRSAYEKHA